MKTFLIFSIFLFLFACKKEETVQPEIKTDTIYFLPKEDTTTYDYKLVYEFIEYQIDYEISGSDTIQYKYHIPINLVEGQVYRFDLKIRKDSPRYTYLDYRITETSTFGYMVLKGDAGIIDALSFESIGYDKHQLIVTTDYPITLLNIAIYKKNKKY